MLLNEEVLKSMVRIYNEEPAFILWLEAELAESMQILMDAGETKKMITFQGRSQTLSRIIDNIKNAKKKISGGRLEK